MNRPLTKLSLFSGILGDDLASSWADIKTVCCVEIDPFCLAVIKKHYPDMPIIGDIHDVTKEKVKEVSGYEWVDIVAGGDPCQPRSIAGKRRGREDDRDLWKDMFRVVCEFKPTWVINENPTGRLTMDFHEVLSDLESQGYETRSFVIPACSVNAPHRRDRVYIVAYSSTARARGISRKIADKGQATSENRGKGIRQRNGEISTSGINSANQYGNAKNSNDASTARQRGNGGAILSVSESERFSLAIKSATPDTINKGYIRRSGNCNSNTDRVQEGEQAGNISRSATTRCDETDTITICQGLEIGLKPAIKRGTLWEERTPISQAYFYEAEWGKDWLEVATALCRVDDGFFNRVARLKALGNAQVPQQIYPIYKAIVEVHNKSLEGGRIWQRT